MKPKKIPFCLSKKVEFLCIIDTKISQKMSTKIKITQIGITGKMDTCTTTNGQIKFAEDFHGYFAINSTSR